MAKTRFTYTINDNFTVEIFDAENPNENNAPSIRQSHRVDDVTASFASKEEATAFAEETIAELLNPPKPDPTTVIIQGEVAADPVK